MRRGGSRPSLKVDRSAFAGFRFPPEVIVLAVRWYLRFGLSYRDLEGHCCITGARLLSGPAILSAWADSHVLTDPLTVRR